MVGGGDSDCETRQKSVGCAIVNPSVYYVNSRVICNELTKN